MIRGIRRAAENDLPTEAGYRTICRSPKYLSEFNFDIFDVSNAAAK